MKKENSIILFNQKKVRRYWDYNKEQWYFSIVDVIAVLTDSSNPRRYWSDLKTKLEQEGSEVYEIIVQMQTYLKKGFSPLSSQRTQRKTCLINYFSL